MNKEIKKLTPLEFWKNFLLLVEAPAKARLLDCEWKDGLEQYDYFKVEIENALKEFEQIKSFCESYGLEFSLINIREALFTLAQLKGEKGNNWENYNKKLKALEIIKEKRVNVDWLIEVDFDLERYNRHIAPFHRYDLNAMEIKILKEVFKNE